ncbi:MAG: T9SS type A sorting domain-containing protein [Calditrichae bacterium]|nr:T9SS type A sorting domain-containing protein [Calditrichota bacterium]MCB9058935.1 T9SS type A sorting domain-containing protein [Calditrichia bacterium]
MKKITAIFLTVTVLVTVYFFLNPLGETKSRKDLSKYTKVEKEELYESENYGENEEYSETDSPDKFAEMERAIRTREGQDEPQYEFNYKIKELLKAQKVLNTKELTAKNMMKTAGTVQFVERGPGNVSGRTRGLVVDPDDPNFDTWYAASVGGGVWKTTNAGQNWTKITPEVGNLATSTIVQSKSNPDVLYIGTGEGFRNVDQIDGSGIWKSEDRGVTWAQLESTANLNFQNVMRLIVNPADENIVLAATVPGFRHNSATAAASGIWRSVDGGLNWTKVYENTGNHVQHLIADPTNFNIQYATVNALGVIKSTDGGQTWTNSSTGISQAARLEIAIASSDPTRLYLSAEGGSSGSGSTLYISRNSGQSWTGAIEAEGGTNINWLGGQGWYDNTINVNPYDENDVYVGGINIWRIKVNNDNTIVTTVVTDGYGQFGGSSKGVHVDQHNIVLVKTDVENQKFRMINCNDGGVSYSDDEGETYSHTENGLNTSQFYGVDKKNGSDEYVGGMQDNNSFQSPADPGPLSAWDVKWGGDGFEAIWHYGDPNKIMVSSQYGSIGRSLNGGLSYSSIGTSQGFLDRGDGPFFTKLAKSKQDPDLVFTTGTSGIWRTDDFGSSWTVTEMPNGFSGTAYSCNIKISLVNPQVIWAASSASNNRGPYVSFDGGFSFEETSPLPYTMGDVSGIATHPTERNTAYILFSFAKAPKIIRTQDLGQTWEDISGFGEGVVSETGFPDVAVYSLIVMPYDTNIIWAGTDIGLFESVDNGASWHYAAYGLPPVAIHEMVIVNDEVVVATHGRGIWTISLPGLTGYEPPETKLAPKLNSVSFTGTQLTLDAEFRSNYDSTQVRVNDKAIYTVFDSVITDSVLKVTFEPDSSSKINVRLYSYFNGNYYVSQKFELEVFSFKNPVANYVTDFEDEPTGDFLGTDFTIERYFGFRNKAVHSPHNYLDMTEYTYTLLKPIQVSSTDARMMYSDVAIVEPGEPGTVFGDEQFYDYVVVEGSKDGVNWLALAPGYDCRFDPTWEAAYVTPTLYRNLFRRHTIDLTDTFDAGETILVRFRLSTDPEEVGWGWVIDSLQIQDFIVGIEDVKFTANTFSLKQNYPNPFNPTTKIQFSLAKTSPVSLRIFDNSGRVVKTLYSGKKLEAGTLHEVVWDGTNNNGKNIASGTYYYQLKAGDRVDVKKMVLIR